MKDKPHREKLIWLALALLVAAGGVVAVLYKTRYGPGASGDSVYYLMGARNLLSGNGFSRYSGGWEAIPITGFPPFFSVLLAGIGLLGENLFAGARYLNALLFGANIFLVSLMVFRYTRSVTAGVVSALLILTSESMLLYHSWVMTEALFIFLMLCSLHALVQYFETGGLAALIFSALMMAAATLTRYVGLAIVGTAGLSILVLNRSGFTKRVLHAFLLGLVSVLPFILWLYRNSLVSSSLVNRQVIFHLISGEVVLGFISEAVSWFSPRILQLPRLFDAALFLVGAIMIPAVFFSLEIRRGVLRRDVNWQGGSILPWLLILFIPTYILLLILNTSLFDASTSLAATRRYLLPVFTAVVVLMTCVVHRFVAVRVGWTPLKSLSLLAAVLLIGLNGLEAGRYLRDPNQDMGYTSIKRAWYQVVDQINEIDSSHLFISDNVELFYFLADRPAYALPISYDNYTQQARQDYDQQVAATQERLDKGAVIVLFYPQGDRSQVLARLDVVQLNEFPQAVFYIKSSQN